MVGRTGHEGPTGDQGRKISMALYTFTLFLNLCHPSHILNKEERNMLEEEMRKIEACGMEKFDILNSSEKTIAILGDRRWPQTAEQQGDKDKQNKNVTYGRN